MDRDEILKRNKDSKPKDEGVEHVEDKSKRYGEIGLCVFFVILMFYKLWKGLDNSDILSIFWGYIGMTSFYKYKSFRVKSNLAAAILGMLAAVLFLIVYVMKTW